MRPDSRMGTQAVAHIYALSNLLAGAICIPELPKREWLSLKTNKPKKPKQKNKKHIEKEHLQTYSYSLAV